MIPNNTLLSENLKNWTISNKQRLTMLRLVTRHDSIPEEVIAVAEKCMDGLPYIERTKCMVFLSDISESGFVFTIRVLITDMSQTLAVRSQLLSAIRSAFAEKGIIFAQRMEIPGNP